MKSTLLVGLFLAWVSGPIAAQGIDLSTVPIADLLDQLVTELVNEDGSEAYRAISIILQGRSVQRPPPDVTALIDGLADLTLDGPTPWVRSNSVSLMSTAGSTEIPAPDPGVGPRLVRLFRESQDPVVRMMILSVFKTQVNRGVGMVLFRQVLTEERPSFANTAEARMAAIEALELGEAGLALLRELHAAGTIRDPDAKALVSHLNSEGRLRGGR